MIRHHEPERETIDVNADDTRVWWPVADFNTGSVQVVKKDGTVSGVVVSFYASNDPANQDYAGSAIATVTGEGITSALTLTHFAYLCAEVTTAEGSAGEAYLYPCFKDTTGG